MCKATLTLRMVLGWLFLDFLTVVACLIISVEVIKTVFNAKSAKGVKVRRAQSVFGFNVTVTLVFLSVLSAFALFALSKYVYLCGMVHI